MTILVTAAAGFVGMHVAERLARRGETVVGLDNFDAYYDQRLKSRENSACSPYPASPWCGVISPRKGL